MSDTEPIFSTPPHIQKRAQALNPYGEQPQNMAIHAAVEEQKLLDNRVQFQRYPDQFVGINAQADKLVEVLKKYDWKGKLDQDKKTRGSMEFQGKTVYMAMGIDEWLSTLLAADRYGQISQNEIPDYIIDKLSHLRGCVKWIPKEEEEKYYQAFDVELKKMQLNPKYASDWFNVMKDNYISTQQASHTRVGEINTELLDLYKVPIQRLQAIGREVVDAQKRAMFLSNQEFWVAKSYIHTGQPDVHHDVDCKVFATNGIVCDNDLGKPGVFVTGIHFRPRLHDSTNPDSGIVMEMKKPSDISLRHELHHVFPPPRVEEQPDGSFVEYRGFGKRTFNKEKKRISIDMDYRRMEEGRAFFLEEYSHHNGDLEATRQTLSRTVIWKRDEIEKAIEFARYTRDGSLSVFLLDSMLCRPDRWV
jgi:hypothetical protein